MKIQSIYRRNKLVQYFRKWKSLLIEENIVRNVLMKRTFTAWRNVTNKFTQLVPRQFFASIFFKRWLQQFTDHYKKQVTHLLVATVRRKSLLRPTLRYWRIRTREKIKRHQKTIIAREHYLLVLGLKVLKVWSVFVVENKRRKYIKQVANQFYNDKLQSLSRVVSTQRLFSVPIVTLPSYFEQTLLLQQYKIMIKSFDAWRQFSEARRFRTNMIARAVLKRMYLLKKTMFERWRTKAQMLSHKYMKERHVHHHHHYIIHNSSDVDLIKPELAEKVVVEARPQVDPYKQKRPYSVLKPVKKKHVII